MGWAREGARRGPPRGRRGRALGPPLPSPTAPSAWLPPLARLLRLDDRIEQALPGRVLALELLQRLEEPRAAVGSQAAAVGHEGGDDLVLDRLVRTDPEAGDVAELLLGRGVGEREPGRLG